ncbi:MAG: pgsA1 [Myxococcales bacterium]|nr:pgsA1 [Myxococcales bacterium]
MDRFYLLAPALLLLVTFLISFIVYCALCAIGRSPDVRDVKHNKLFGPFVASFLVWLLGPIERLLIGRVSPNVITTLSLLMCAITGLAAGLGHLPGAVWLYSFAGILDVLDGRLARLGGKQNAAGALFDSVSDRWGELFVFTGYAWYLHDSIALLAVMGAVAGSMMVSYTRARAEGLGIALAGGVMQRAERVVLVAGGTLFASWYAVNLDNDDAVVPILGVTMLLCAVASTATALNRWIVAHRELAKRIAVPVVIEVAETIPASRALAPAADLRKVRPLEQH